METIRALPIIYNFLENKQYSQAISVISQYIEVLSPHIDHEFPSPSEFDDESCLLLCKFFLLRKEYRKSILYGLKAKSILDKLEPFYYDSLIFRIMDELLENHSSEDEYFKEARSFVLDLIQNDPLDDSKLGYLVQIKEYDMIKKHLIELSKTDIDCGDILLILLELEPERMRETLIECSLQNDSFFEYIIDSFILLDKIDQLKSHVSSLPWNKMYAACFYIEDTHDMSFELENENANFILSGQWKQEILSNFLFRNNKTNFKFLEAMSKARAPYMALANSFMNAGTTNDSLYRNNRALVSGRSWNRFLEFGSFGMIHQGNIDPFEILKEVLPSLDSSSGEPGSLLALGIMSANRNDDETTEFFLNWLDSSSEEMVFGACLGIGLNVMGSADMHLFERIKALFAVDNTIIQESALFAIGLIFASTENKEVTDFVKSIHDKTDFPRVKRVCGISIALINALSDDRIDLLEYLKSDDSSVRSMGLLSLGTAYVSTSNLDIIEKILPFINDGDDETKRSAVFALSLIGYGDHDIKNICLIPLAENHNSFVRSAVAMCLGLFNSGVSDPEVCSILEAMMYDSDDLVRQNACIGAGFALIQGNPTIIPNYKRMMDRINHLMVTRSESQCVKIGASLGRSIAETSGRSSIFTLRSFSDQIVSSKVVGALLFFQSWYWYPLIPCISLCHQPTPLFFFDKNLDETDDCFINSDSYYDYFVKLPDLKKSRKFKAGKTTEQVKDILEPAKNGLKSGDRLTYKERLVKRMGSGIFFKEK